MTRARADLIFTGVLAAAFAWATFEASTFPDEAKLFPLAVAIPAFALVLLHAAGALRRARPGTAAADPGPEDEADEEELSPRERARRGMGFLGWIAAMLAGVWLVGFVTTCALIALAYSRVVGRESWRAALGVALVSWGLVFGVFDRVLHVPLPEGELLRLLGVS